MILTGLLILRGMLPHKSLKYTLRVANLNRLKNAIGDGLENSKRNLKFMLIWACFTSKIRNPLKMPGSPYKEHYKTSRKQMKLSRYHQNLPNLNSLMVKVSEEKLFLKILSKIFQTA